MTQLTTKIKLYANKEIDFKKDVILQDDSDGNGAYIKEWNLDIAQPTQSQLDAFEEQANAYEQNIINEQANKEKNKQSAINKLKSLGLNEAEINSILGI